MRVPALDKTAALLLTTGALFAAQGASVAQAAAGCDIVVAPNGSDSAVGTLAQPLRTIQGLLDTVEANQTACLAAGSYAQNSIKLSKPGITLTGLDGAKPTIAGRIWIAADNVTLESLKLDGGNSTNLPSPSITGADDVLRGNEITNNHRSICLTVGSIGGYGRAQRTLIEKNKIHDCGALPATNFDHGIYVENSDGAIIRDNWIYDNANRGIQFYPNADNSTVTGNVIDGNGEGIVFGGDETHASDDNLIEHNVISNSKIRDNVESAYGDNQPVGKGNVVRQNCIHGGAYDNGNGGILSPHVGFSTSGNLITAPKFVDRSAGNFALQAGSECAQLISGQTVTPPSTEPTLPPATTTPQVSLQRVAGTVKRGHPVRLRGKASGVSSVTLYTLRTGDWHRTAKVAVKNGKFRVSTRAGRAGIVRYRAIAAGGHTSSPVVVRIKRADRHRHRR